MLKTGKLIILLISLIVSLATLNDLVNTQNVISANYSNNINKNTNSMDTTRNDKSLRCVPVSPSCGCYLYSEECRDPGNTWHITGSCNNTYKWQINGGYQNVYQYGKYITGTAVLQRCQENAPPLPNTCLGQTCNP